MKFCPIMTKDLENQIECSPNCKWYESKHNSCRFDKVITEVESVNLEYIDDVVTTLAENNRKLF